MGETRKHFLVFKGHFERDSEYTYAISDPPAISAHGKDEADALAELREVIPLYVDALKKRGEFDVARQEGIFTVQAKKGDGERYDAQVFRTEVLAVA